MTAPKFKGREACVCVGGVFLQALRRCKAGIEPTPHPSVCVSVRKIRDPIALTKQRILDGGYATEKELKVTT